jgi:hypothetical protein
VGRSPWLSGGFARPADRDGAVAAACVRVRSGAARTFDLASEAERIELYEIVLTDGTAEDISRYVNREELLRLWPRLWLPPYVRQVWDPRLGVVAS